MEQRLTPLAHLEEFLDSNEIIFRYNKKQIDSPPFKRIIFF